jgi:23S rRNA pseudouridine955/2504/2580 synthase/23S rRNA pseudouridine1911/1915/1917 synthase
MSLLEILFENDDIVAVNKPAGILSVPDRFDAALPSLKGMLREEYGEIFVVHRLDRETSGVILFAKNADTHKYLSALFEERSVEKEYLGLVQGSPVPSEGTIDEPLAPDPRNPGRMWVHAKGKHAVTHYKVLESYGPWALVSFTIETGRTHQIRVHLQRIGHTLVGDTLYGDGKPLFLSQVKKKKFKLSKEAEEERPLIARLALHAHRITFTDAAGQAITVEAPMQRDMEVAIKQLRKWS